MCLIVDSAQSNSDDLLQHDDKQRRLWQFTTVMMLYIDTVYEKEVKISLYQLNGTLIIRLKGGKITINSLLATYARFD